MAVMKDISGMRFGMLVAQYATGEKSKGGNYVWHCVCDCGKELDLPSGWLLSGHTRSCGCRSLAKLQGMKFGKLTVLGLAGRSSPTGGRYWLCKCDCGNTREATTHDLRVQGVCQCEKCAKESKEKAQSLAVAIAHQKAVDRRSERLYRIWCAMRNRCNNPSNKRYKSYGGRGIRVSQEWDDYLCFKAWANKNGYNDSLTIERKDVNGNYCPENCTWIELRQQSFNKRETLYIVFQGKEIPVSKLVYDLGLEYGEIVYYLKSYKNNDYG